MNKPKSKKSTREEVEHRVAEVFVLWVNGVKGPEISAYSEKAWGIATTETYEYIKRARALLRTFSLVDLKEELGKALLRRETLYRNCFSNKDWLGALAVERDRCDILGLYAPQKVELTTEMQNPYAHLNKTEAIEVLAKLEAIQTSTRPKLVPNPKDEGKRRTG